MATLSDISEIARQLSRDFGTYFEINYAAAGATLRLPHPLVQGSSVSVVDNATSTALSTDVWAINERNGLLQLQTPETYTAGVTVTGVYHQWFLDEDLDFHANLVSIEHLYHRTGANLATIDGVEVEVMGMGCLVSALWALLTELATDIDVSSPEGMNIPAHQRFNQVQQLITYWTNQYEEKAAMINVGLKRIEQFTLRRQSRLTNRLVPLYRVREIDNPKPPVRVRPPIDPIEPTAFEEEDQYWNLQEDESTASSDLGYGGWDTIGSSGGTP